MYYEIYIEGKIKWHYCFLEDTAILMSHMQKYIIDMYTHTHRYIWPDFCVDEILSRSNVCPDSG